MSLCVKLPRRPHTAKHVRSHEQNGFPYVWRREHLDYGFRSEIGFKKGRIAITDHPRNFQNVQTFNLNPKCRLTKSAGKLFVTIDTSKDLPSKTEQQPRKLSSSEMESLIADLQEQVATLSTFLEEERLRHKGTKKRASQDLVLLEKKLEGKYEEEAKKLRELFEEEKLEIFAKQEENVKEIEASHTKKYDQLLSEFRILQASFKNYRNVLQDEMQEEWKTKNEDIEWKKKRELQNAVDESKKIMEEKFAHERDTTRKEFKLSTQKLITDHREEIDSVIKQFTGGSVDITELKKKAAMTELLNDELEHVKGQLAEQKIRNHRTHIECEDAKLKLRCLEQDFDSKVSFVEDAHRSMIDSLKLERSDIKVQLTHTFERLHKERIARQIVERAWTDAAVRHLQTRIDASGSPYIGSQSGEMPPHSTSVNYSSSYLQRPVRDEAYTSSTASYQAGGMMQGFQQHPTSPTRIDASGSPYIGSQSGEMPPHSTSVNYSSNYIQRPVRDEMYSSNATSYQAGGMSQGYQQPSPSPIYTSNTASYQAGGMMQGFQQHPTSPTYTSSTASYQAGGMMQGFQQHPTSPTRIDASGSPYIGSQSGEMPPHSTSVNYSSNYLQRPVRDEAYTSSTASYQAGGMMQGFQQHPTSPTRIDASGSPYIGSQSGEMPPHSTSVNYSSNYLQRPVRDEMYSSNATSYQAGGMSQGYQQPSPSPIYTSNTASYQAGGMMQGFQQHPTSPTYTSNTASYQAGGMMQGFQQHPTSPTRIDASGSPYIGSQSGEMPPHSTSVNYSSNYIQRPVRDEAYTSNTASYQAGGMMQGSQQHPTSPAYTSSTASYQAGGMMQGFQQHPTSPTKLEASGAPNSGRESDSVASTLKSGVSPAEPLQGSMVDGKNCQEAKGRPQQTKTEASGSPHAGSLSGEMTSYSTSAISSLENLHKSLESSGDVKVSARRTRVSTAPTTRGNAGKQSNQDESAAPKKRPESPDVIH